MSKELILVGYGLVFIMSILQLIGKWSEIQQEV